MEGMSLTTLHTSHTHTHTYPHIKGSCMFDVALERLSPEAGDRVSLGLCLHCQSAEAQCVPEL